MSRSANTEGSDEGGKRVTKSESDTKGVENLQPTARSLTVAGKLAQITLLCKYLMLNLKSSMALCYGQTPNNEIEISCEFQRIEF